MQDIACPNLSKLCRIATICAAFILPSVSAQQTTSPPPSKPSPLPYSEAEKAFAVELTGLPLEASLKTIATADASRMTTGLFAAFKEIGNKVYTSDPIKSSVIFEEAEAVANRVGDPILAADARSLKASGLLTDGETFDAIAAFDQTLAMYKAANGSPAKIANIYNTRSSARASAGDLQGAVDDATESLRINRELGDEVAVARAESSLANALANAGNFVAAQEAYDEALRIARAHGEKLGEAFVLNNMSMMYSVEGDFDTAIRRCEESLKIKRAVGSKRDIASSLINLATFYSNVNREQDAKIALNEAAQIGRDTHIKAIIGKAIAEMGIIELSQNHPEAALKLLQQSDAEFPDDLRNHITNLNKIAECYYALKNYELALKFSADAADISRRFGLVNSLSTAALYQGQADVALGKLDDARAAFKESIAAVEQMRDNVAGGAAQRQLFLIQRTDPYRMLAAIEAQQGDWPAALDSSEKGKGRILLDVYAGSSATANAVLTDAERKEEARLQTRFLLLDTQHTRSKSSDPARQAALDGDLAASKSELASFRSTLYQRHPELRLRRADFAPSTLTGVQTLIPNRTTALLEYELTPRGIYMFVITRGVKDAAAVHGYKLTVSAKSLAKHVRKYHDQLSSRDPEFVTESRWLYAALLQPAALTLKTKTSLIIVPDGVLWHVPFQSLQRPDSTYMAESTAITYVPSLSVLHALKASTTSHHTSLTLLAMGDPGGQTPEEDSETKALQTLYGPKSSKTFLGKTATLGQFRLSSASYDVLHIAAHGIFDDRDPMSSHMLLASTTPRPRDGWLQARELQDMKLRAQLVVLSGCETGQGSFEDGEGLVGMSWAALAAGAHGTVASAWRVEAHSTTEMMLSFHTDMLHGISKSEALRRSELKLIHSEKYSHPFYWAAFDLMGDGV